MHIFKKLAKPIDKIGNMRYNIYAEHMNDCSYVLYENTKGVTTDNG